MMNDLFVLMAVGIAAFGIAYVVGYSHGSAMASAEALERMKEYFRTQNDAAEEMNRELLRVFKKEPRHD